MQLGIDANGAQSRAGVLTFITINACFVVATSILNVFPVQRLVFERDRVFRLYSVSAYYVSIVLTELPFIFIFPILSSVIYYWSVDLRGGASHYFTFLGILMLIYAA